MKIAQSSRLLINEPPLQVLPSLAYAVGLNGALFLQQLQYWLATSRHVHDGRRWIYNTTEEWARQFPFWSERTIKRIIADLRDREIVLTRDDLNKHSFDHTLWYSINYDVLESVIEPLSIVTSCHDDECQAVTDNTNRIPETSSKELPAAADPAPKPNEFVAAYERIWGMLVPSPYVNEEIQDWEKRVTYDGWCYALKECADSHKRGNMRYFRSILTRIERDGFEEKAESQSPASQVDFTIEELL